MSVCSGKLAAYRDAAAKDADGSPLPVDASEEYWRDTTLFVIAQTRAGNCYPDA